jgi:SAM-dependent methyltransferase
MEDIPFWLSLAQSTPGPLLELGCGTGRVMFKLADRGFQVFGLDNDREMLVFLNKRRKPRSSGRIHVLQADMTSFRLRKIFPLIYVPCNTWSILDSASRQAALSVIREHLLPDGIFAASLPNPVLLDSLPGEEDGEVEDIFLLPDGTPVQVSSSWLKTRGSFLLRWNYDLLFGDGRVERYTLQGEYDTAPVERYLEELSLAGFDIEDIYGSYHRSPYSPDSPYFIFTARRKT